MSPRRGGQDEESRIRFRPNPKGSRPRTKDRPTHENAVAAQVVTVDRGRYGCLLGGFESMDDGGDLVVTAMKARELGKAGVVVGDRVGLVGDVSGSPGSLARIVRVEPRTSVLRRSADDTDKIERVIVANAAQLAVVTALADPVPRPRMVDRCLVAAYDAGLDPLLVLTKADLADPAEFTQGYSALEVPWVVTRRSPGVIEGLDAVREQLAGRVTVLVGHSGVGKSTLVNALTGADRAIGRVNDVTGRGRHTSTSAIALRLPGGGWVVDTPGVRSFGLGHVDPDRLVHAFPELAAGTDECPRGCGHDEPECGLDAWVDAGKAGPSGRARLESLRRLLRARSGLPDY
ncbi:ribosome small subunit-dependent GTPase A [Kineosporia sp. J2-2]|uniref:Ribosome small subunit-dependent GTPase A n=1 Tax=Kineosporia corallincola TaxID=2835133 RepID=A0ABS5TCZ8_9ACTN|nr:ribosome small subunit-dependent GTPase A [Kineosporia corallincola]MBT0768071.1 ribosome small subunit-dependent GTPase A [Kineosporia corallincola]